MKKVSIMVLIFALVAVGSFASNDLTDFSARTMKEAFAAISADSAIGSPITVGTTYIIPLFEQKASFGGGSGGVPLMFGISGGGVELLPYAVLVIRDHEVEVLPVSNVKPFLEQIVDALPKIIPIVMDVMGYFMVSQTPPAPVDIRPERAVPVEEKVTTIMEPEEPPTIDEQIARVQQMLETDQSKETYEAYLKLLEELLRLYPDNAELHALSGQTMMMLIAHAQGLGQLQLAMRSTAAYNSALEKDPNNLRALIGMAWMDLYSPTGNLQNSIQGFERVLSIEPNKLEALIGAAEAYTKAGNHAKAQEMVQRGLAIDPTNQQLLGLRK